MPLKTLVKVGSITNLSDARYCAGMGVDLLGFRVLEGQENYINPKTFQEIRGWVTGPAIAAEIYGITSAEELRQIMADYRPDYLEMDVADFNCIGEHIALPYVLCVKDGTTTSLPALSPQPAYLLVSPEANTSDLSVPVLWAIKTKNEATSAAANPAVKGICLDGGHEIRPGLKNYDDLADILELLEVDS